ncbi:hypothetical protein EXA21_09730, partial [Vibrio cincinnatiensis]|uniref:CidA/LrgA family protein n=1 Tax=Vibrio cincinnatiensis TaxID=675 RepID=UPI001EDEBFE4
MNTITLHLKTAAQYLVSMGLIFLCLWAGITIQHWLGIAIPGSIIGLLFLFTLLASGLVPIEWVRPSAHLFIRYMILLFVPISVGLMVHFDMLLNNLWPHGKIMNIPVNKGFPEPSKGTPDPSRT